MKGPIRRIMGIELEWSLLVTLIRIRHGSCRGGGPFLSLTMRKGKKCKNFPSSILYGSLLFLRILLSTDLWFFLKRMKFWNGHWDYRSEFTFSSMLRSDWAHGLYATSPSDSRPQWGLVVGIHRSRVQNLRRPQTWFPSLTNVLKGNRIILLLFFV